MEETPDEPSPANPMLAGMEGLIAAMRGRKPAPRDEDGIGLASTELGSEQDESDALEAGQPGKAITSAQRAVAAREHAELAAPLLAQSRFVLARALWDAPAGAGRDRPRALALATQARDVLRAAGKHTPAELATVEAWLAVHERDAPP